MDDMRGVLIQYSNRWIRAIWVKDEKAARKCALSYAEDMERPYIAYADMDILTIETRSRLNPDHYEALIACSGKRLFENGNAAVIRVRSTDGIEILPFSSQEEAKSYISFKGKQDDDSAFIKDGSDWECLSFFAKTSEE